MKSVKILMVCLGNICRSPTAQGVLEAKIAQQGLSHVISVDSAGTSGWHIGSPPDPRSRKAASKRGYNIDQQKGRQVNDGDFNQFDYIFAMDKENLAHLKALCPSNFKGHLGLLLDFGQPSLREVPDPYHGGTEGFEHVLDLIENACDHFIQHLQKSP
jgi:protein-tyrosine phosphatase